MKKLVITLALAMFASTSFATDFIKLDENQQLVLYGVKESGSKSGGIAVGWFKHQYKPGTGEKIWSKRNWGKRAHYHMSKVFADCDNYLLKDAEFAVYDKNDIVLASEFNDESYKIYPNSIGGTIHKVLCSMEESKK